MKSLFSTQGIFMLMLLSLFAVRFAPQLQAGLVATYMQFSLYYNCYGWLSLFSPGFSAPSKPLLTPELDMGNMNLLKLQLIYVLRYLLKDQFFLEGAAQNILQDIETRLEKQFQTKDWTYDTFAEIPVPTHQWGDISNDEFFRRYVANGIPVIIKGFPSQAKDTWSPEYFDTLAGDHEIAVINTTAISSVRMNISTFVASQRDPDNSDVLYIRALSDIFDLKKNLEDELGHRQFNDYLKGRFLTSQIFMGMKRQAGTSYHCANFNNLFFQIQGRKKWTFVDTRYNALMYPMFNEKSMDVASFVTSIVLQNEKAMKTHFPLYKFAPKMVAVLEPGDVLFNPPWQWHQIENLEDSSIGVATRWLLEKSQLYQNSVHSNIQFLSPYIWSNYYEKAFNLNQGIRSHKASNTVPIDERFNFGRPGSAKKYRPKIFTPVIYEN